MATIHVNKPSLVLHDVEISVNDKTINKLLKNSLENKRWKFTKGKPFRKCCEDYQRIYVNFYDATSIDEFMERRCFEVDGRTIKILRNLPESVKLREFCVTGLKIFINTEDNRVKSNKRINENDLKCFCEHYGEILECRWTNAQQTEALFSFSYFDTVDKIIFYEPSPTIKGCQIELEKTYTVKDLDRFKPTYGIHITNLPNRITSEELSNLFGISIFHILVYPLFNIVRVSTTETRSASEAWILGFNDKDSAYRLLATRKERSVRQHRIQCEVIRETIYINELCPYFRTGQCEEMETCHFSHITCEKPVDCRESSCLYGHHADRTTTADNRPHFYSEDARYRIKISNLPPKITRDEVISGLGIHQTADRYLILQSGSETSHEPVTAYFIRQPLLKKVQHWINKWHEQTFFQPPRKIKCQIELNQDYFEWNEVPDESLPSERSLIASPAPSVHSFGWWNGNSAISMGRSYASVVDFRKKVQSKSFFRNRSSSDANLQQNQKPRSSNETRNLRPAAVHHIRPMPQELLDEENSWSWTNKMVRPEPDDIDQVFLIEDLSNINRNLVLKFYSIRNELSSYSRACQELAALNCLQGLECVPKIVRHNINLSNENKKTGELWIAMDLISGQKLNEYAKQPLELREALNLTIQLIDIVKKIHGKNIVHRDLRPQNILIRPTENLGNSKLMLINFTSAWINSSSNTSVDHNEENHLGNTFYRMPQFESHSDGFRGPNENEAQIKARRSPNIDASGICAILFWLITHQIPRESKNIGNQLPHVIGSNSKLIQKSIQAVTSFQQNKKVVGSVIQQMNDIFNCCFDDFERQLSINELDYRMRLLLTFIQNQQERDPYDFNNQTNDIINRLSSIGTFKDAYVRAITVIDFLKDEFAKKYPQKIKWAMKKEKNHWIARNQMVENIDSLEIPFDDQSLSLEIKWEMEIDTADEYMIHLSARMHNGIVIVLPSTNWTIGTTISDNQQTMKKLEIELRSLIETVQEITTA